ncbi:MAG: hypothetical protein K6E59_03420 [Bacilli bacterium]|nr:hypothetical protein [Bacilli bacterium]
MSKNKKKQNKKKQNPQVAANLRLGFSTLISNDAVIRASREWKMPVDLIPITIALASVVLAILPTFVTRMNTQGSTAIFSSPTANMEQGLSNFVETLVYDGETPRDTPIDLIIDENGTFQISDKAKLTGGANWYTYNRVEESETVRVFEVFFNDIVNMEDSDFYTYIDANKNPYTLAPRDTVEEGVTDTFRCSYLAFGKNSIRFRKRSEVKTSYSITGDYAHLHGYSFTALATELKDKGVRSYQVAYNQRIVSAFSDVINRSYDNTRVTGAWQYTGIFAGIDLGLIILFGGVLFLMTRGKKNPFRIYTFWETQKMAYWASFTPAVLSMAIGFWLTQYAFIFFMFAYGMRMMWMSMRSMRPAE